MNSIGENEKLLELLTTDYNLLSSTLQDIRVQNDNKGSLCIELQFKLLYTKAQSLILLKFSEVNEFSFYHNQSHYFYNVEDYKLLKAGNSFYLSLDPYLEDAEDKVSSKDQDFILCNRIEGFA